MRATHSPSRSARSAGTKRAKAGATTVPALMSSRAPPVERELRSDELGLVRDHERERGMRVERAARGEDHRLDRVGERVGAAGGVEHALGERRDLTVEDRSHQRLAAGEAPVHRGPGATGFLGDVVEGGLGDPDPGDARERGVEHAVGDGRRGGRVRSCR